ncbi:hypothetical protein H112_02418 [Trichophyton rubrum D6]|uniref:Uncharacterized protein n=4 Tax=Trichophyton TaxID=5550 RepID=A0A178F6Z8_TRIRU|nr:uncharacterized protein TERG_06184 [Trichophyton rubrum CBS 118892]EZF25227.1 hypothetical protein H100_02420 [Trichophyton rubrum MR850]EZF44291.1 hypothetical protein H102_02416 [Trichophyton rubrum CBS 100081]EZF54930.1 hypothetical protein H103_02428 [Trichophyton rubrum CBS 288.86]EZF65528.1 hypothetical protein H104_02403 [Trichophyton rubrum CBS 289.86]EZF76152.1 hypothetical protein H105_02438 [Trichophyton soudanense CBS 452.61]EZF86840.1 hypothetical protein H110_02422 [Trichophy
MTPDIHHLSGNFDLVSESLGPDDPPHTYRIAMVDPKYPLSPKYLPVIRTLHLSPNHTIDPPSQRMLELHRSIATILHLSGARDTEEPCVPSDGSHYLGELLSLKLNGWIGEQRLTY